MKDKRRLEKARKEGWRKRDMIDFIIVGALEDTYKQRIKIVAFSMAISYIMIIAGALAIDYGSYGGETAYQEDADTTSLEGSWTNGNNLYDGDWDTYGYAPSPPEEDGWLLLNYSKMNEGYDSYYVWVVKNRWGNPQEIDEEVEITLPEECTERDFIYLNWTGNYGAGNDVKYECQESDLSYYEMTPTYEELSPYSQIMFEEGLKTIRHGYLNLTFSETTNGTLTSEGTDINYTGTNLTIRSDSLEEGKVKMSAGEYQFFEYDNEEYGTGNWTHIEKGFYIMPDPDTAKSVKVWAKKDIKEANVWIYRLIDNEWKLVYGFFTDSYGEGNVVLEGGEIYKFEVYKEGYQTYQENHAIQAGDTSQLVLKLNTTSTETSKLIIYHDCEGKSREDKECTITVRSTTTIENVTAYGEINGSGATDDTRIGNGITEQEFTYEVNWINTTWDIDIYVDGERRATIGFERADTTYNVGEGIVLGENADFFILIMLLVAGVMGGIAGQIIPKSGIYVFAMTLMFAGYASQNLALPMAIAVPMIIGHIARRMMG